MLQDFMVGRTIGAGTTWFAGEKEQPQGLSACFSPGIGPILWI